MDLIHALRSLGIKEKAARVYRATLERGPAPVRTIAAEVALNRQTTYDLLKELMTHGLVSYYHVEKRQHFVAEDPEKLLHLASLRRAEIDACEHHLATVLPELKSVYRRPGEKPVAKFFEGTHGIATILRDVLETVEHVEPREYLVYSSRDIRSSLYQAFPNFTEERVHRNIPVRVLALGGGGGADQTLAERRDIRGHEGAPTYRIIYGSKTAFISLNRSGTTVGVIIEDSGIAQTERVIFEVLWKFAAEPSHV